MAKTVSGKDQGDERMRTIDGMSKYLRWRQNCGYLEACRISPEGACLLSGRRPAERWHELDPGFCAERGNLPRRVGVLRENLKWRTHKRKSTDAEHGGGLTRSSDEVSVMGMERRGCIVRLY